jgi:hypothetical protein
VQLALGFQVGGTGKREGGETTEITQATVNFYLSLPLPHLLVPRNANDAARIVFAQFLVLLLLTRRRLPKFTKTIVTRITVFMVNPR